MKRFIGIIFLTVCLGLVLKGWPVFEAVRKSMSADPAVWQEEMDAFVADRQAGGVPQNALVFVGSSSFRLWSTMAEDLAPLPVVNRGFGGAVLGDIDYWAEVLLGEKEPTAVVVFCGTNDIVPNRTKEPQALLETYQSFVSKVRALHPGLPIYYIAITPSPRRWEVWDRAQKANELIAEYSASEEKMYFIDTGAALLGDNGEPDVNNYKWDKLHLSAKGYAVWTSIIKPRLMADFAPKKN